jgi:raffinose/stachyose/melibiose transport system permease protein
MEFGKRESFMQTTLADHKALEAQHQTHSRHRTRESLNAVLFLMPALVVFLIFVIYPILRSLYFSLFNWNGLGPAVDFVGLQNFVAILSDQVFIKAVENGLLIVVLSLAIQLPMALLLALMLGRDLPGRAFFRTIFFLPYVLSEVITAITWLGLYNPDPRRGFINALLVLIPGAKPVAWLGDIRTVMLSIFVVLTWKYFGLHMLLYMAGLQNIPTEVEEAARIDGANNRQLLRYITWVHL